MNPALPKILKQITQRRAGYKRERKSGVNNRLPLWFRQEIPDNLTLERMRLLSEFNVNTVCQEAKCPNLSYCFKNLKLTFMILGNICTRNCRFCGVNKSEDTPLTIDQGEPYRISQIVKLFGLKYVVITSVSRDDLLDGGAAQFARTIELIHRIDRNINPVRDLANPSNNTIGSNGIKVEALIPDFKGDITSLKTVIDVAPCVVVHNIETVKRLYKEVRPKASYRLSLDILTKIKELKPALITKSSIILGLGETEGEVVQTMEDLRYSQCDILTLGQYLAPGPDYYPIKEFIGIEQFQRYQDIGYNLGFKAVLSGSKVRSSYQAEEVYRDCLCMI